MTEDIRFNIRRLRRERNWTQEDLAELLGVTGQAVSKWESGAGLPDVSQILPLANAFGVTTDAILSAGGNISAEEAKRLINELLDKSSPPGAHISEGYDDIAALVRQYPNNLTLCYESCGYFANLAAVWHEEHDPREAEVIAECERVCNIMLQYDRNLTHLGYAYGCLSSMCILRGDFEKAEEHARSLDFNWGCAQYSIAHLKRQSGERDEAIRLYQYAINNAMYLLGNSISSLGLLYQERGEHEDALTVFRSVDGLIKAIYKDEAHTPPLDNFRCELYCARSQYELGDLDGAMDTLEQMYARHMAGRGDRTARVRTPLLRDVGHSSWSDTYDYDGAYSMRFALDGKWFAFEKLRNTERFRALQAKVDSMTPTA
ncbi:MAG: helix-turn-helix domain-containing protein [Oscillospiraceae bacterium]|jgi:transcriptional regulator with XRE-family HTH domain|nr:helix-turn-helix domain-containing protein [Oscillospiraceae bacterium]